nr:reverse transcriptase domain-containing protein [Tanacetum cinerariifolium]
MTAYHNDWDTFVQRIESSSSITSSSDLEIVALKAKMVEINKNLMKVLQINQKVKAFAHNCETCGGPHSYNDCPAIVGQTRNMNTASSSGSRTLPSNTITNPKEDLKGITARSGNAYKGPLIPTTSSPPKVVGRETEIETPIPNYEPVIAPVSNPVVALVSAPKHNHKSSIPYPSRLHDQKLRDKANKKEKFFKIFKDLDFNISFADALILMPKFGPTIKGFLTNKEKLYELARTPLNEHCSAVLLKKLPEKLGDPDKFLILCDFLRMDKCLALADLGASINLMPLSMWNKLSLPELSPTCMTLELTDRSIYRPVGVSKDVFVKVGTFHFQADFVVVDFDADPQVPLILGRSFLKTRCALIDVYEGELTLRVGKEAVTFNLDQTTRYSANYDAMSVNQIDLIDVGCEEYSKEVLGFSMSGNPTPSMDPIVSNSSPTLTPFGDSDFLLEETDAFLAIDDEPISSKIDDRYFDSEGDILLLEEFLNDDPSSPPLPLQELKVLKPTNEKSSIDEPPVVQLKDLPPHLEYAFLEGDDKLPVIIAKDLKDEEKNALIKVLKSHKQALAWQLSDIKGINQEFYTHKILMEDDFKPAVQHQKRVNPKYHEEKSHFMVKEGIVLGHKISKNGIEVDKAKVDVIAKLPHPNTVKGAVLGQQKTKYFQPIHYESKTMTDAQAHYTTTEKELLAVVYAFEKFQPYLVLTKSIVYTDHSAIKYLFNKKDAKPRLLRWVLLLQEFDIIVRDKKGDENLATDHLSRLGNPHQSVLDKKEINETFPLETLNMVSFRGDSILDVWGIDFMGPFPSSRGNNYILMAVDYLSKWVEAKALPTNDTRVVCKFLKSLFARFGTPHAIISDHGTHFCNDQFAKAMLKYGVTHRLATAYHPQTSGQVEVSNRGLKRIFERTLGENRASWSDKLDDTLWAFRTVQLNELNELRDQAYENSLIYKEKTKRIHDSKIKDRVFNIGDQVLLFNSRLKILLAKLKTRWFATFTITQMFPYGTVKLSQTDGPNFKVNGHRLKHYFGEDIPKMVVQDL